MNESYIENIARFSLKQIREKIRAGASSELRSSTVSGSALTFSVSVADFFFFWVGGNFCWFIGDYILVRRRLFLVERQLFQARR